MHAWIIRRVAISLPVLLGISVLAFGLSRLAPGDPVLMMVDPAQMSQGGEEFLERRRAELGLDKPLPVQYVVWFGEVAHGNLGSSFVNGRAVGEILKERIWPTVELMGSALLLALLIGVPVGILAALRPYSPGDYAASVLSLGVLSVPSFFLALAAIYLISVRLDLLPTAGMYTAGAPRTLVDDVRHLILPAGILGLTLAGPFVRYVRAGLLDVLHQEYLVTASAKGLRDRVVILRHALPNALIPFITIVAIQIPALFGGAVIMEQIFSWPGMGQMALAAISQRDYPVLLAFNMATAVLVVSCNLLADVAYAVADPRVRYG